MPKPGSIDWRHGVALPQDSPQVLPELIASARAQSAGRPVLVAGGEQTDWDHLETAAARVAAAWADRVQPGDRVAIMLPNGIDHLIAELAAWRLGAVAAPLRPGSIALASRLGAVLTVASDAAGAPVGRPWLDPHELRRLAAHGPGLDPRPVRPEDPCLILATSGSTGEPRAVVLPQRSLCSQQAAFAALWPEVGPGDRLAAHLPWSHSFGGLAERLWALCRGCTLTVVAPDRDAARFAAAVRAVAPTVFMTVPKMHRLATQAGALDPACLRWVFSAGAALGAAEDAWYTAHGVRVYEGWGLTECGPSACITPPHEPRRSGSVGWPIPGVSVGVRDDGRILVAGPGLMRGYHGAAEATRAITGNDPVVGRWLDSGDAGAWTPAGLRLAGRADLVVKLENGEKVELAPLAARLEDQPGVRMAVALCRDGRTVEAILAATPTAKTATLRAAVAAVNKSEERPWCRIRSAWALSEDPRPDNGLLTPSFKIARAGWLRALAEGATRAL